MRKSLFAASLLALTVAVAPACATKKFVRTEVGNVNSKVDTLSGTVEQTQERIRQNEARIGPVDQKAEAAGKSAEAAQRGARRRRRPRPTQRGGARQSRWHHAWIASAPNVAAGPEAGLRSDAQRRPGQLQVRQDRAAGRSQGAPRPGGQPAEGRSGKNVFIEIEGHTDNVGDKELNEELGMERAEAVKRYLYEQHQIPLHKINVISYGEDKPVAPNNTRDGRAQNRRVVIQVLS